MDIRYTSELKLELRVPYILYCHAFAAYFVPGYFGRLNLPDHTVWPELRNGRVNDECLCSKHQELLMHVVE